MSVSTCKQALYQCITETVKTPCVKASLVTMPLINRIKGTTVLAAALYCLHFGANLAARPYMELTESCVPTVTPFRFKFFPKSIQMQLLYTFV